MKSGDVRLKFGYASFVARHDGPDIYVLFNGVPAQGRITCTCLVEPAYSRQHAEEWFVKSIPMIV